MSDFINITSYCTRFAEALSQEAGSALTKNQLLEPFKKLNKKTSQLPGVTIVKDSLGDLHVTPMTVFLLHASWMADVGAKLGLQSSDQNPVGWISKSFTKTTKLNTELTRRAFRGVDVQVRLEGIFGEELLASATVGPEGSHLDLQIAQYPQKLLH